MGDFISVTVLVLAVIYAIIGLVIYHKLFYAVYFDLGNGCLKEFSIALFIGLFLSALTVAFWYVSIPIIALFLFALFKRK